MKKAISIILCLLIFTFAAACKDNKKKDEHGVDIAYFANMGAMYESELKIHDAVPAGDGEGEDWIFAKDGKKSYFSNGNFCYYYDGGQKEPEIYAIVALANCMGFETGDISIEITDVLNAQEIEYAQREPEEDEVYFLPEGQNREIIECKGLKYVLKFVIEDNALCAAFLEESENGENSN